MRRTGKTGRVLIGLLSIATAVVVVGLWQDWFRFSAQRDSGDKVDLTFTVDKAEVHKDAKRLRKEAADLNVGIGSDSDSDLRSSKGTIAAIDAERRTIELNTGQNEEMSFSIGEDAEIRTGGEKADFDALQVGDQVVVAYRQADERARVQSVTRVEE